MPLVYVSAGHRQQAHPVRQFVRQSVLIVSSTGKVWALGCHTETYWQWKGPTYPYRHQYSDSDYT